jgi:hypothetical protein
MKLTHAAVKIDIREILAIRQTNRSHPSSKLGTRGARARARIDAGIQARRGINSGGAITTSSGSSGVSNNAGIKI